MVIRLRNEKKRNDEHVLANCVKRSQQAYNFNLGSIYADGSDYEIIQGFEVNFSDGCVCARTYRVDEAFEGFLSDNDLINYMKQY